MAVTLTPKRLGVEAQEIKVGDSRGRARSTTVMPKRSGSYRVVLDSITDEIRSGRWKPGDRLPTYEQLAAMYDASVTTVQAALRILDERGLIERAQGKGMWVADPLPPESP